MRAEVAKRYWKPRLTFLQWLKDQPCQDCGGSFPPECMDFDHVRGVKRRNVSSLSSGSWEGIAIEVRKCDLVCANCHRVRTTQRGTRRAA